ncbi:hypothetical protein TorRG33x02_257390 [Trema orientale]|uniref:Uncharacterized protein n=1 Tax=Trema orientale TaxID=63057 RepID=A0A2P5DA69_TREOI|nr:hypothetical protein TorRG33x02_257390 [Trema orientale]
MGLITILGCVAGTSNGMLSLSEKIGELNKQYASVIKFQMTLSDRELSDLGYVSPRITWNNKRDRGG